MKRVGSKRVGSDEGSPVQTVYTMVTGAPLPTNCIPPPPSPINRTPTTHRRGNNKRLHSSRTPPKHLPKWAMNPRRAAHMKNCHGSTPYVHCRRMGRRGQSKVGGYRH